MNRQSNSRSPGQTRNVVVQKKQESNRKVDAQARVKSPLKRSGQGAQAGSKSPSNRQKSPSNDMRQQFNNMQKNKQVGRFSPKKNSEKSPKNISKVSEKKLPQETPEEKLARLEQKKEGIVFLCRVAEQAENFEDLIEFLRQLVEAKLELDEKEFSTEEHNMISVGLRNYVGQLQSSIRVISALCQAKKYKKYGDVLPRFKVKMQLKLKNQIMEAVAFLSKSWKLCDDFKSQVLHQKLMGDHYRYAYEALNIEQYHELDEDIAKDQNNKMNSKEQSMSMEKSQIDNDLEKMKYYREPLVTNQELEQYKKEQQSFKDKAQKAYAFATVKAEKNLLSSNPYRLGLALNYTLFLYDVMGQKTDAKKMAKRAIEVANKKIEQIKDQMERQDAETIIELIEENLRQWQEDEEEEQEILNR